MPAAAATAGAGRPERPAAEGRPPETGIPGSTRSLPLVPLSRRRVLGAAPEQGLYRTGLSRFALVGVVWDDPGSELHGRAQVRTRSAVTRRWSGWQDIEAHNADHGADPGTAEHTSRRLRGATAPLWVGDSDGVDVRVRADATGGSEVTDGTEATDGPDSTHGTKLMDGTSSTQSTDRTQGTDSTQGTGGMQSTDRTQRAVGTRGTEVTGSERAAVADGRGGRAVAPRPPLPRGLRLELVDPGEEPGDAADPGEALPADLPADDPPRTALDTEAAIAASGANSDITAFGATEIPELDQTATEDELVRLQGPTRTKPHIGPRPRIVTRRGWGADESLRERGFVYTKKIKAAFVHHTATGNKYTCAQAPSVIRGIYRYHVKSMGWRDVGYNFLVDKCGNIYEGRAGGVAKAVLGAHTLGFNTNSMGIAVIGTYSTSKPAGAAVTAVARLTAWKLGLYGVDPSAKTYLTSGGGNLYPKGKNVRLNVISGHRDGYATECPGKRLYAKLGTARSSASRYQGR
ncbi:N-acetylmuramoyl-L-alanine amidase [Streptomyces sp. SID161]|uniref:peptidoglycan recognition protein family protein n=1 Tax=Streptomyces sp. SID161 TaxID=2690251 RepID=UPI0013709315|nr:N-acetylmuramoyl-L-alanine amidase [Streptomyces sp. SID161]MYW43282.1 N-acetylmuramoyl-L-alanine amidase [Streptomyces sp. SID161]